MKIKLHSITYKSFLLMLLLLVSIIPAGRAKAEDAAAVSIGKIDYEKLTLQVFNNNNSVIYYSTDNSTWTDVDGAYDSSSKSYTMDISWVSSSSDVTLYFKGDVVKTVKTVNLPERNSTFHVTFDKVENEFTFYDTDDSDTFQWRKASDYNWTTVDLDESSASYEKFMDTMDTFYTKGAKLLFRLPQVAGTGINSVGTWPSREVSVAITARASAPNITVNTSKLTLNTTTAMEYYDSDDAVWVECDGAMPIKEIAPAALYANGAKTVTVKIRRSATSSNTYSKTAYVTIPGQPSAPTIGDSSSEVTYYYMNSKLVLQFNSASKSKVYEYAVVKSDDDFDAATARWTSVNSSRLITISAGTAPDGCTIYVRKKGTDAAAGSSTSPVLSSAANHFAVDY